MLRTKQRVFDIFISALTLLEKEDSYLYRWKRNRLALTHALALHLDELFREKNANLHADMAPCLTKSSKILNPDILVHNRDNSRVLALVCKNDYISETEQQKLLKLASKLKCELVMGVSFFPQKNYMLLYCAEKNGIKYFHFDRNTCTAEIVRAKKQTVEKESNQQLNLL